MALFDASFTEQIVDFVVSFAASPWVYLIVFGLVFADAFFPVVPGEIAVVMLGTLALSSGQPNLLLLIVVAASAAIAGDNGTYAIGRFIKNRNWKWLQSPQLQRALSWAGGFFKKHAAALIFTARYIPFARIAVNLTAGSLRYNYRRFLLLNIFAALLWAMYYSFVGALFGYWLSDNPLLAIVLSISTALLLGLLADWVIRLLRARRKAKLPEVAQQDSPAA